MHGNDHTIIKAANRQLILNTILEMGPMSVMDILHQTRLSRPTIEALLREMQQDGILEEVGTTRTSVGRAAKLYAIGVKRHFSIGVDLEFPGLRVAAVSLAEEIAAHEEYFFRGGEKPEEIIQTLLDMIRRVIAAIPKAPESEEIHLLGIGVGISGLIDRRTKQSISIERIAGWRHVDLVRILKEEFDLPVHMRNDVHMLSLIHQTDYARKGTDHYLYVSLRSGIGMALFIQGSMFSGVQGNAGFLGHTTVDINGPKCICGNRGCLETYLNPVRLATDYFMLTQQQVDYPELLNRFAAGDEKAAEVFKAGYTILGKAMSNVVKITDIRHLIISGMPEGCQEQLIAWIQEGISSNILPDISQQVSIEAERIDGEEAKGAGIYILRHFFADPKLIVTPNGLG